MILLQWLGAVVEGVLEPLGVFGVFLLVATEAFLPFLPSELMLFAIGSIGGMGNAEITPIWIVMDVPAWLRTLVHLVPAALFATVGSLVATMFQFRIAAGLGQRRVVALTARLGMTEAGTVHLQEWLARHYRAAVFFSRMLPGARCLLPVLAGAAKLPAGRLYAFATAGSWVWNHLLLWFFYVLSIAT